jgi:methyl-accepting chemotaxis protein
MRGTLQSRLAGGAAVLALFLLLLGAGFALLFALERVGMSVASNGWLAAAFAALWVSGIVLAVLVTLFWLPRFNREVSTAVEFGRLVDRVAPEEELEAPEAGRGELQGLVEQLFVLHEARRVYRELDRQAVELLRGCIRMEGLSGEVSETGSRQADLMERSTGAVRDVTASLRAARELTLGNEREAAAGAERVEAATAAIGRSGEEIQSLEEQTAQVEEITSLIRDLADQTDLLALNAAIEAARAGEFGKGFSVVAREVQKLAEKSAQAALEISELVQSIRDGVKRAAARNGEAAHTVLETRRSITAVGENVARVLETARTAAGGVDTVQDCLDSLMNLALESAGGSNTISEAFRELREHAQRLTGLLEVSEGFPRERSLAAGPTGAGETREVRGAGAGAARSPASLSAPRPPG